MSSGYVTILRTLLKSMVPSFFIEKRMDMSLSAWIHSQDIKKEKE